MVGGAGIHMPVVAGLGGSLRPEEPGAVELELGRGQWCSPAAALQPEANGCPFPPPMCHHPFLPPLHNAAAHCARLAASKPARTLQPAPAHPHLDSPPSRSYAAKRRTGRGGRKKREGERRRNISNIIYLDSPAGVGMSYSLNKSDYTTGDLKTAADTHKFLLKWFKLYPEFQSNPFYISGESYAGYYIPTLTDEVVKGIDRGVEPRINFKGYMIGNGATDVNYDYNAFVPFAHGMGLISTDMYEDVKATCRGTFWGNLDDLCQEKIERVHWELKDLNKYNILAPCYHHPEMQEVEFANSSLPSSFRRLGETEKPFPVRKRMAGRSWPLRAAVRNGQIPMWPGLGGRSLPCMSDELATLWLDDEGVRAAIHAKPKSLIGSWELYTARIDYTHDTGTMQSYHKKFTAMGYRVLIYSGDHDLCVPFTGTEAWVKSIGYQVVDRWRPWYYGNQVAGYTQGYDHNLTFLTIKGAGHAVPEYKPKEALTFYSRWLAGKKI
ncbi:unnamed protein product [Urochloa decumbens]|uniref:Carboxypeptidase n=1 Tax=Urochloa decumbens TaxID=240449 RepID=A0ABC9CZ97_9POAL